MNILHDILGDMIDYHLNDLRNRSFKPEKFIEGQNLHSTEHEIGHSDLAFVAYKGQKRPIFYFKLCNQLA